MALTLDTDPIMTLAEAQQVFDTRDPDRLVRMLNSLSETARQFMNRKRLTLDTDNTITEVFRSPATPSLYLHAPVYYVESTHDVQVDIYSLGAVLDTFTADAGELVVLTNDRGASVSLASGAWWPGAHAGDTYLQVTYYGGWATVPSPVVAGAIMQGRVDLKRLRGEVGMVSHSQQGESIQYDRAAVISEVADLWRPYKVVV